jgi:autotransporter-associated beta strand protein
VLAKFISLPKSPSALRPADAVMKHPIFISISVLATISYRPQAASAQTVLLSADEFSVLGGTGITVAGTGYTFTNGNIGLSPGATTGITGFPPATIAGNTRSGSVAGIVSTGGVTQQAMADLMTAQGALTAMSSNVNLSDRDLGGVGALFSGVYTFNTSAALTGALILDANFQNSAAWVFNMGTTLITAAKSSVQFINLGTNGGSDLGLFWNAGTAITVGDNNTILGNYLAGTSISFSGSTNTNGSGGSRALAQAGVTFAGPGAMNTLGGPVGNDWDGGLKYNALGQLVLKGEVLLSSSGVYTQGSSSIVLVPGTPYQTQLVTIDGSSRDGEAPASLTIDTATATLTGLQNTYTGGTIVNNGALITSSANLPVDQSIALNKGTLTFNQTANGTFGGAVTGDGSLTKIGTGTLTLSGANTYTGATAINAGVLNIQSNTALGTTAGSTTVASGAALQLQNNTSVGAETLTLSGTGVSNGGALRSESGTNTWGGNISITADAEIETASGSSLTVNGNITGSGTTLTVESIGSTTFNGINTFGTLAKTGAGTLIVTSTNTYGTANISAGNFALGASNILSNTMDINVTGTGNFDLGSFTDTIDDLVGSGTLTVAGSGNLTIDQIGGTLSGSNPTGAFSGTLDVDGIMTLNGGTIGTGADGSGSTGSMILTAGNTLTIADDFNFGGTLQLGAGMSGASLALMGAGTTFDLGALHVIGASSIDFSGVDATTLNLGSLTFAAGATLSVTGWQSFSDLWTSTLFPGATLDTRDANTAKVTFAGFTSSQTIWLTYDYGANEITVPEPSSYGALLMGFGLASWLPRRRPRPAVLAPSAAK